MPIRVPRVRSVEGGELPLRSYEALSHGGETNELLLRRVLYGISCRNYEAAAAAIPGAIGLSSSSVSRGFVEASAGKLREMQERDLTSEDVVVLFLDGKTFAEATMVVALGITLSGEKRFLGFVETDTENERGLTPFLRSLLERGLDISQGLLVVIDGSKGLRAAVRKAFRHRALVHRCQWHKRENVVSYLSKSEQVSWRQRLQRAYNRPEYKEAFAAIQKIHSELEERNQSAASLEEGLEETLTLHRLGVYAVLGRSLKTTNCLESVNALVEERCAKVDHWKNSSQRQRWLATALADIEPRLRKVMGYRHLPKLREALKRELKIPWRVRLKCTTDFLRIRNFDPGIDRAIDESVQWLYRAQDHSSSKDGGVAHSYSLLSGWSTSYPETTGYIIPTLLEYARLRGDAHVLDRARRMLDWLVSIQMPDGSFPGGRVDSQPRVSVTFNTGQILFGLVSGTLEFGDIYRAAMQRCADWLVETQDSDGCWRQHPSPFAMLGDRTYDTHVAWALLEAARIEPARKYAEAGLANIRWALTHQSENGWFDYCCLSDRTKPLTHTIGYTLRGMVEGYRFSSDDGLLAACRRTADGLLSATAANGFLPGQVSGDWRAAASWSCLTGSVQTALCWMMLYEVTGTTGYWEAARKINKFVRTTIVVDGDPFVRGGVAGSFPIYGDYGKYRYLNWAAKFFVDANMLEQRLAA